MACIERDIDHSGDDGGSISTVVAPVDTPFENNQEVHIAKQESHKAELG